MWCKAQYVSMEDEGKPAAKNLLASLLEGGDSSIKLITLALVVVTGGGNFLTTKQAARSTDHEVSQAIHEIHDLHGQLNAMVQRQTEMHEMLEKLTRDKNQ